MKTHFLKRRASIFTIVAILIASNPAFAGIFDLPSFLEEGKVSVGLEPEVIVSNGTGAGFNFKARYGVNNHLNWQALIGTGSGDRNFRLGAIADFDWFPDVDGQPGIATPVFGIYRRIVDDGELSIGSEPMIYKTFAGDGMDYTPFFAVPIGWNMRNSHVEGFMQIAIGSMFKLQSNNNLKYTLEVGFNAKNSFSYISGGLTYFFD